MTQGKIFKDSRNNRKGCGFQKTYQSGYVGLMSMLLACFIIAVMAIYYFDKEKNSSPANTVEGRKSSIEKAEEAKRMIEGKNIDMSQF